MKGHCACQATGQSSHAIAKAFGHCNSGGTHYPHDPSDLLRCINYCRETSISTSRLRAVMAPISPEWDALTDHWHSLEDWCDYERERGDYAPTTYAMMRRLLDDARKTGPR